MDERDILDRIGELIDEEHRLRAAMRAGQITADDEHERLSLLEQALDQSWDLLRRRRAARDADLNPDSVAVRPVTEVEGYLQ